ncbi:MAG: glucosamine-6-phosphate deaminase [Bacteroidota bacterium]
MNKFVVDNLSVFVSPNRSGMGKLASDFVAEKVKTAIADTGRARMIFAAAASQTEFLEHFRSRDDIKWEAITAFHMDEYLGLDEQAPQRFGNFLKEHLFNHVPCKQVELIQSSAPDLENEITRYARLLQEEPIDVCCLGIGENGHLAFNDPPVADFDDPVWVKEVELDSICRQQQVNDGAFQHIRQVPKTALTLTIPALLSATTLSAVVPGPTKARAVNDTLTQTLQTRYPSTILRSHPDARLFLDQESSVYLNVNEL